MTEPTVTKASGGGAEPFWRRFRPHNIRFTLYFTYFELKKQYADSALGVMWMVVEPLLRMGLYVLVFAVLLGRRFKLVEGGESARFDYALYILSGLVPWHFVSFSFSRGMGMITSYAGFIRQPNVPYRTLPSVMFLLSMPGHLTSMAVLLGLYAVAGRIGEVQWHLLALAYLLIFFFMRGLITALGAATARIMDLRNAVPLLLQVLMYTSPIIYKPEMIPEKHTRALFLLA